MGVLVNTLLGVTLAISTSGDAHKGEVNHGVPAVTHRVSEAACQVV